MCNICDFFFLIKSKENEVIGSVKSNIRKNKWTFEQSDSPSDIIITFEKDMGFITNGELNYNISIIREKNISWTKMLEEVGVESDTTDAKFVLKQIDFIGKYFGIQVHRNIDSLFLCVFTSVAIKKFYTLKRKRIPEFEDEFG